MKADLMAPKTRYLKLPFCFDERRLGADLAKIREGEWIAHANTSAYEKDWRCVPLRSVEGRSDNILSIDGVNYRDSEILSRCPYFREVIDSFQCEKTSVRLMEMGPGSTIKLHKDRGTSFEGGTARIHVPIMTAPAVLFTVEDEDVHFSVGNAWYLNASCLHGVRNESDIPRIHLMLDCVVNPWLEKIFLDSGFEPDEKPKYGDPSIDDKNVGSLIAMLLELNTEAAREVVEKLTAIRAGQS